MKILTISGSARPDSRNVRLLQGIASRFPNHAFSFFDVSDLPLFKDQGDGIDYPFSVIRFRNEVAEADAVIISTPEYLHNIPAALKNALEWVTQSGEFANKKVLPITFTPAPPRGEKAMQSLTWSLQALDAYVTGQLDLYQNDLSVEKDLITGSTASLELLDMAIQSIE